MKREIVEGIAWPHIAANEVSAYAGRVEEALGEKLLGLYITGSFARGCYQQATSDIDMLAVIGEACSPAEVEKIVAAHKAAEVPFDSVFVTQQQAAMEVTPTPVDLLVKPPTEAKRPEAGSADFIINRQDAYETGVTLAGSSARELLSPVSWEVLEQALEGIRAHVVEHFKNPVLMLCRIEYAKEQRKLSSKKAGGEWALEAMAEEWRRLIEQSLHDYAMGIAAADSQNARVRAFERYCLEYGNKRAG